MVCRRTVAVGGGSVVYWVDMVVGGERGQLEVCDIEGETWELGLEYHGQEG